MKKITFPHMGNLYIPAECFFREMGFDVVTPPQNSKKTLDLGVKHSPEFACLPLKINIGNFIETLDMGAEIIIMGGGVGPCRFGYYGEVQREILEDIGYDFEMVCLEPQIINTYRELKRILGKITLRDIYKAGKLAWIKTKAMDAIHKKVLKARAREKKEGSVDKIYDEFLSRLKEVNMIEKINTLEGEYKELINATRGDFKRGREIKIGIVGEIYVVLEPFTNLRIEKKLGDLGVTVEREIYLTHWIYDFLNFNPERELIEEAAEPYLSGFVGGHGLESVGNTVIFAREGFDGVIQVAPFTCMPEIVAQTILPLVSKGEGIPVLSFIFDEHTGEAGLITRLEAFIDLLLRKKNEMEVESYG